MIPKGVGWTDVVLDCRLKLWMFWYVCRLDIFCRDIVRLWPNIYAMLKVSILPEIFGPHVGPPRVCAVTPISAARIKRVQVKKNGTVLVVSGIGVILAVFHWRLRCGGQIRGPQRPNPAAFTPDFQIQLACPTIMHGTKFLSLGRSLVAWYCEFRGLCCR